jgi:hypothetical protein
MESSSDRHSRDSRPTKPGSVRAYDGRRQQTFEEGDRVGVMRVARLTSRIQIVEATVLGMLDDYRALIGFSGGADLAWPIGDLTRMPSRE